MSKISETAELIEELRNGRMVILMDAEDRENEGDLVCAAQMATPNMINFMAKYGRGLICLTLPKQRAEQLQLPLMSHRNQSRHQTNFTVSIEAREGISTGISAHDRAHTIATAINLNKTASDIVSPGHVFPLVAREGGVLVRSGHTEAACDMARLAGLYPAGVICEIMNDDGTMARMPELLKFSEEHSIKIGTIADLIAYRRRHDDLLEVISDTTLDSLHAGVVRLILFRDRIDGREHAAIVKGNVDPTKTVPVRVHAVNLLHDLIGMLHAENRHYALRDAMKRLHQWDEGIIVLLHDPERSQITQGFDENTSAGQMLREYGIGARILYELGARNIELISNSPQPSLVALEGYGLKICGTRPLR